VFDIFDHPKHPYTQGLLHSIPRLDSPAKSKLEVIDGMVPGLLDLPSGCRFQNRCPLKIAQCENTSPGMEFVNSNHQVSCLNWKNP